jgi:alpha-beta hydrolase superfamily lysophospholipase
MGNQLTYAVERAVHSSIYRPPPVNYQRRSCLFAQTRDGDSVAMRLYSQDVEVVERFNNGEPASSSFDLLLFSHGNGSDIGETHRFCEHMCSALGMDVLVYDYPEYGHSSQTPASQSKLFASIDAVFEQGLHHGWTQARIFLMGHSLGSVPTLYRAAQDNCRVSGVVLLAPLASGPRVFLQDVPYVPRWVLKYLDFLLFDNVDRIKRVKCPIAIVHGTNDYTVTAAHTELLKKQVDESCQYPSLFLPTGHNELVSVCSRDLMKITQYIRRFRDDCLLSAVRNV